MPRYLGAILLLSLCFPRQINAQNDSIPLKKVALYGGVGYAAGITALSVAWYGENGFENFKVFNDNGQWNQLDKFGHAFTTYQLARGGYDILRRTELSEKEALYWATGLSFALLLPIEILDGFSPDYGFSYGDLVANAIGSGLFLGEQLLWKEQRIKYKFSFYPSQFAKLRPEVLGENFVQQVFKDYNGQTYWLSFDIHAFMKKSRFPKWLNIAAGYGATGMVYATEVENNMNGFSSYRQYYLGIDFDFSYIKTNKRWLNTLLFLADMIKWPAPAIEINKNGVKGHLLSF
jgi:hypothetical protein